MSGVGTIINSAERQLFQLGFEISPVILSGGVTAAMGGMLPIIALTETANFVNSLLGGSSLSLDQFLCHWKPMPGWEMISYEIGEYPFANQTVAANAMIKNATNMSFTMDCPVKDSGGYLTKLITFTALQATLLAHAALGGTYILASPTAIVPNCVLLRMSDQGNQESKQVQTRWQFDFRKPLLTINDAQNAQNALMSQISGGGAVTSNQTWTGIQTALSDVTGGNAFGLVSGAANLLGTSISSLGSEIDSLTGGSFFSGLGNLL
jgi:hypothetical protein